MRPRGGEADVVDRVSEIRRAELDFNVTAAVGGGEQLNQRAWLFIPKQAVPPRAILVCLAGAGYDKHYWHLQVHGYRGYSFAEHFAACGYVVVAVDHLGVGDSTDPVAAGQVTAAMLARGDAEVVNQVRARAASKTLHSSLPAMSVPVVGVGHSLGAGLALAAQAGDGSVRSFDALVLLGYVARSYVNAPGGIEQHVATADSGMGLQAAMRQNEMLIRTMTGAAHDALSCTIPRGPLREMLYAADVPEPVIAADEAHATRIPVRVVAEIMTAGTVEACAAGIDVPVFLGFGGVRDMASDPRAEALNYPSAIDITTFVAQGAAHAHNLASTRTRLWDRIAAWLPAVLLGGSADANH